MGFTDPAPTSISLAEGGTLHVLFAELPSGALRTTIEADIPTDREFVGTLQKGSLLLTRDDCEALSIELRRRAHV